MSDRDAKSGWVDPGDAVASLPQASFEPVCLLLRTLFAFTARNAASRQRGTFLMQQRLVLAQTWRTLIQPRSYKAMNM